MLAYPLVRPDENLRALIKNGPVSVETSLKEVEENYASKPEWKVIEGGGVLSVPVEEFRMINPPKPDREGNIEFEKKRGKKGVNQIESYTVGQTVPHLNAILIEKYNTVKEKSKAAGKSAAVAEREAEAATMKLPEFNAVQKWLDIVVEIKLKERLIQMMTKNKIPALVIRSVNLKALSSLNDLGLELPDAAEVDLLMAYVTGHLLHVVILEVKRADTFTWQDW